MLDFLSDLNPLLKGFWYVALISSVIFALQTLLTFIGGHDTDAIHTDFDGNVDHVDAPFQLFSFRNLINFLLGFGWTGVVFYDSIGNKYLLIALATLIGLGFIYLFFLLIKQIMKLSEDNTFKIESLIEKSGRVYMPIPENMAGKGKIQISVNGTSHELEAMTEGGERLASGTSIIVEKIKDKILIVKKIS